MPAVVAPKSICIRAIGILAGREQCHGLGHQCLQSADRVAQHVKDPTALLVEVVVEDVDRLLVVLDGDRPPVAAGVLAEVLLRPLVELAPARGRVHVAVDHADLDVRGVGLVVLLLDLDGHGFS